MNYQTKEQREENNKYMIYCSICDKKLSYEGFYGNHLNTKLHLNNLNLISKSDEFNDIVNKMKKIKKEGDYVIVEDNLEYLKQLIINNNK